MSEEPKLPTRITIGPYEVDVCVSPSIDVQLLKTDRWGEWDLRSCAIRLFSDLHPSLLREVLLHEVVHAVFTAWNIDLPKDAEEVVASNLAVGLLTTFRNNPELVKFLMGVDE